MQKTIIKRDGLKTAFDINKIYNAIIKAMEQTQIGVDEVLAKSISEQIANTQKKRMSVEEIQDMVEDKLMSSERKDVAKEYITYRAERSKIREKNSLLMNTIRDLTYQSAEDNDVKRENANIDGNTAMGTMLKYGSEASKIFYKDDMLKPQYAKAHEEGIMHIHDLDFLSLTTTCCQIDIEKLFKGGFSTGHGHLREPNDIQSYSALACIAIQSNQNDQHGGQSIPNFDYGLSKGVAKTYSKNYIKNFIKATKLLVKNELDDEIESMFRKIKEEYKIAPTMECNNELIKLEESFMKQYTGLSAIGMIQEFAKNEALKETERATYQAMESFIHNLNTMHSRAGAQVPFSSINYGTDITPEGRMVIKNLLLATEAGLGNGETPIFPIQIFKVKKGVNYNEEDPNYDLFKLSCRVSAKRLFPNFSFIDAPFNLQYYDKNNPDTEIAYMGCRTRVISNIYDDTKQVVTSRGNLSFTTIPLPRIAIESKGDIGEFYKILDSRIELVTNQLLDRFEIQARKKVRNYPFLMGQGVWMDSDKLDIDDEVRDVIKHGTLTTGFIGLAECLKALTGKHHGESEESQKLGLEIITHMRKRMDEKAEKYKLNFSLIATPSEGTAGRFVKIDRKDFGIIEGVTDRDYYTNSFHVPVYHNTTAFEKIRLEAPYHELTNAGHISYVELDGDPSQNLDAFESIVRAMKEAGIGYGSINHPVDRDPVCGYTGIIGNECPRCGRKEGEGVSEEKLNELRKVYPDVPISKCCN